jgi:ubiquinone/menaquinone biosynthesis C-methylase UbiE
LSSKFASQLRQRSAEEYADFLIPNLDLGQSLLDVGCGSGEISVGLAQYVQRVTGVDLSASFEDAEAYLKQEGIGNVEFLAGNAYELDYESNVFDVCVCHSTLEALEEPELALNEMNRVLKPGGILGVASVEYSGLILYGDNLTLLNRFYEIRRELWQEVAKANPFLGQTLRKKLHTTGFVGVEMSTKSISYGTPELVLAFGRDRAKDCVDPWYEENATRLGIAQKSELREIADAWKEWSTSTGSYLSFAWCRAIGHKPRDAA